MACDNLTITTFTVSKSTVTQNESGVTCTAVVKNNGTTTEKFHISFTSQLSPNPATEFAKSASTTISGGSSVTLTQGFTPLVVGTINLCANIVCETVAAPVAAFSATPLSGAAPLGVVFTNQSTGVEPMTYAWDFNNSGYIGSTVRNPPPGSTIYSAPGYHSVALTVTDANGVSDKETKINYINVISGGTPPVANFTYIVTSGTLNAAFTNTSTGSPTPTYVWNFGDGTATSTSTNPSHTYASSGTYIVSLTATNSGGNNIKTATITIPPVGGVSANFSANPTSGTKPLTVQFTDTSTGSPTGWSWAFGDGTSNTTQNPSHQYTSSGVYGVTLTVTKPTFPSSTITKNSYITVTDTSGAPEFGADERLNSGFYPIGGGTGYNRIITSSTPGIVSVSTRTALASALASPPASKIIFIPGSVTINFTGTSPLTIPSGVTVASDRGNGSSTGATLRKDRGGGWQDPIFNIGGDNVRVTGIILKGESLAQDSTPGESTYLSGILARARRGLEVDNCEITGWSWAGVFSLNVVGDLDDCVHFDEGSVSLHNCYIHRNQARGEGYGVQIAGGYLNCYANTFDYNRHSICASGLPNERYDCTNNIHFGHGSCIGGYHFDVHESGCGKTYVGSVYNIKHNTVKRGDDVLAFFHNRDTPTVGMYIENNDIDSSQAMPIYQKLHYSPDSPLRVFCKNNRWRGKVYSGNSGIFYIQPR